MMECMMEIIKIYKTAKGEIFIGETEEKKLIEFFIQEPINNKLNIVVSTQYGCSMKCAYCNTKEIEQQENIEEKYLKKQIEFAMHKYNPKKETKVKIHFARVGEPTFNFDIFRMLNDLYCTHFKGFYPQNFYPVIITSMPKKNKRLLDFLATYYVYDYTWIGELQLSINIFDNKERKKIMPGSMSIKNISRLFKRLKEDERFHKDKKITLNFFIYGQKINFKQLKNLFSPNNFLIKITPLYIINDYIKNNMVSDNYYEWEKYEKSFKDVGYEVIVKNKEVNKDKNRFLGGDGILNLRSITCKL